MLMDYFFSENFAAVFVEQDGAGIFLTLSYPDERSGFSGSLAIEDAHEFGIGLEFFAVQLHEDISFAKTRDLCGTVRINAPDKNAVIIAGDEIPLGEKPVFFEAEPACPADSETDEPEVAVPDQFVDDRTGEVDRDGKAEPFGTSDLRGIDADHFSCRIEKGAAAVALVDGGVRLYQVFDARTVPRRADPGRHRAAR